jgi:Dolichyl-phosphate-mannose-protein mannosyltransferase
MSKCGEVSRRAEYFTAAVVYAALTLLAIAAQYRSGAYGSDFSLDPDEPAHAVSCLMVRDYLVQSFPASPLAFARDFYAHYPKVAIGHWPPLFYCTEAVWMLAAGRSRIAMLLFVALCGGALLSSVYCAVRRRTSTAVGLMSSTILFCFPTFQQMLCAVRPDLLLALLTFWASLFCGRMVLSRRRSVGAFVELTLAALLVHGRASMLLLLPFCLFPFRERKAAWKWLVPVGVFVFLFSLPFLLRHRGYFPDTPHWRNIPFLLHAAVFGWGPILIPIAAIGVALAFRPGRYRRFWATMSASFIACCLFLVLLPFPLDHYFLITALPSLAVLIGGGIEALRAGVARLWMDSGRAPEAIIFSLATLIAGWKASHVAQKPDLGYHRMVAACLLCRGNVSLVAGDALNEGALIAEGSLADVHRTRTILRGSKVLANSTWSDHNYRMLYATTEDVDQFLDRANVGLIVLQTGAGMKPHVVQLDDAIAHNPAWVRVNVSPTVSNVAVYQRASGYGP